MRWVTVGLGRLGGDERGATAIEYTLLGSLVAVGCIAAMSAFGAGADSMWADVAATIVAALGGG
jgi:Flp pilus assembly pilin Flp